ncbi:MAG: hypothetical protein K1X38_02705 [Microthrixaceae bacterium]|nr:hypothetical protein [Microthrixaceae bacterium]
MNDRTGGTDLLLSPLDELTVPDLRSAIAERATTTYAVVRPRSGRPARPLIAAAIVVLVGAAAFAAGRSTGGRDDVVVREPQRRVENRSWRVAGTVEVPWLSTAGAAIVAPTGRWAWVSSTGATTVAFLDGQGRPTVAAEIAVPPVVDLAALGRTEAVVLSDDGVVRRLHADGQTGEIARVDAATVAGRRIASRAGIVWVTAPDGRLLRIDAFGTQTTLTLPLRAERLVATERDLWVVDATNSRVTAIDADGVPIGEITTLGAIAEVAPAERGIYAYDPVAARLIAISGAAAPVEVAPIAASDDIASTRGTVWTIRGSVLQGYDSSGTLTANLVPVTADDQTSFIRSTIAGSPDRLWVAAPRRGQLALIGPG